MDYTYLGIATKLAILRTKKLRLEAEHFEQDMEANLAALLGAGYEQVAAQARAIADKFEIPLASLAARIEELEAQEKAAGAPPQPVGGAPAA